MVGGQPNNKEGLAVVGLALLGATIVLTFIFTALKDPWLIALEVVVIGFVFITGLLLGRSTRQEQDAESRRLELDAWNSGRQELAGMYNAALKLLVTMVDRMSSAPKQLGTGTPHVGFREIDSHRLVADDKVVADATMVYNSLYNRGIHPTQTVLTGYWPELFKDHNYMTQCLDYLADCGVCTRGVKGKERTWIYSNAAADSGQQPLEDNEFDEFARR